MYIAKCITKMIDNGQSDIYYLYKNGRIATYCEKKQAYKTEQGATASMRKWVDMLIATGHAEKIADNVILEHGKYINTFSIVEI